MIDVMTASTVVITGQKVDVGLALRRLEYADFFAITIARTEFRIATKKMLTVGEHIVLRAFPATAEHGLIVDALKGVVRVIRCGRQGIVFQIYATLNQNA